MNSLILILFFISIDISSQTIKIGKEEFDTILYPENANYNLHELSNGSFIKNKNDFILCRGRAFNHKPPESKIDFYFNGEKITNFGEFINLAVEEFESGNYLSAIEKLESARNFDPVFFPTRYNLGRFYFIIKKFHDSEIEFIKSKELIPEYNRIYIHLAEIELFKRNKKKAEVYLAKAHEFNPFENDSLILLIQLVYDDKLESRAIRILKKIENSNDLSSKKIAKGIFHFLKKEYSKAYDLFIQVPYLDNKDKDIYYFKAFHFYFAKLCEQINDLEKSKTQYKEMLEYPFDNLFREIDIYYLKKKF